MVRQWHWPADGMWRRTPDGFWMFLRPGDFFDACYAYTSPDESYRLFMPKVVRPGDWAIDAGGQKGWYAMQLARAVGPTGQVLTVEADPTAAELLQANLRRNGIANVRLFREAAGDATREVEFHLNAFVGWSSMTPSLLQQAGVTRRAMVPMRPLDDMLAEAAPGVGARVSFLKIDVEGAEAKVLRGATRILTEHAPLIWMEINPSSLAAAGSSAAELGRILEPFGYRFWRGRGEQRWPRKLRSWFRPCGRLAELSEDMDVLCVPPSREEDVLPLLQAFSSYETGLRS